MWWRRTAPCSMSRELASRRFSADRRRPSLSSGCGSSPAIRRCREGYRKRGASHDAARLGARRQSIAPETRRDDAGNVHPEHVARVTLSLVDVVIAVGHSPDKTLGKFADATGTPHPRAEGLSHQRGHAVVWFPRNGEAPFSMKLRSSRAERIRHLRKYAEGTCAMTALFPRTGGPT